MNAIMVPTRAARAWAGLALLSGSWLLGLSYYQPASWTGWLAVTGTGTLLLSGSVRRRPGGLEAALTALLLIPVIWLAPWPYRLAFILIALGAAAGHAPVPRRWPRALASGMTTAGVILLAQALGMTAYAHVTARSHELPAPLGHLLAFTARLLGIDAGLASNDHGRDVVLGSMRQTNMLGATWELFLDPPTMCFLIGGVVLLALAAWSELPAGGRIKPLARRGGGLALCVLFWLPVRSGLLMGVYLQRLLRTDYDAPLDLMTPFWDPWVHLLLLAGPVLLAWRFIGIPVANGAANGGSDSPSATGVNTAAAARVGPRFAVVAPGRFILAVSLFGLAGAALTAGWFHEPHGARKPGRVLIDEYHSDWEPSEPPFDTERYGRNCAYDYSCIADYCSRFYDVGRLHAAIDDAVLKDCDVLMLKTPDALAYAAAEVDAIRRFVVRGGGLLLIGEHTDVFRTGTHLNGVARAFGFRYRPDCLFGMESVFKQRYQPGRLAHPIVRYVPPMDFATSCSIDPGWSPGRAAILSTGLKNRLADYHAANFYPQARDDAQMRYGAFIQLWTMRYGLGRVAAFTDSTQFSSFCTFDPGKSELMLGMIEWLNHAGQTPVSGMMTMAGWLLLAAAAWAAWPVRDAWLAVLAVGALGACAGAFGARHVSALPPPPQRADRPMTRVMIDRTVCASRLPVNGFIAGNADEFGIFERWVLRLGYFTARRTGPELFTGDLAVFFHPDRTVPRAFRDGLAEYVKNGGKVLILDSPSNRGGTANGLLHPFGLRVKAPAEVLKGRLETVGGLPAIPVEESCEVIGGEPLARLDGKAVAVTKTYGKGTVTVIGFGGRFTDANMGVDPDAVPDAGMREVFDFEFKLLRSIIEGRAATRPSSAPPPASAP